MSFELFLRESLTNSQTFFDKYVKTLKLGKEEENFTKKRITYINYMSYVSQLLFIFPFLKIVFI